MVNRGTPAAAVALLVFAAAAPAAPGGSAASNPANRLGGETSPYLLQHAGNPVNWYAWGPEAIEAARAQDKPIFLSIGYSTCYWCHVMERESFEDQAIADFMNEHFISIKVDREQRPDIDDIYMAAVEQIAGRGGWPLSVFLEPTTLAPFEGGTYFPPESRGGQRSFLQVLEQVNRQWHAQRPAVMQKARSVADQVRDNLSASSQPQTVGRRQIDRAVAFLMSVYDATNGGFRHGSRKFPQPARLQFLIGAAWDDPDVQQAVRHTLDRMAMGGIYDQVGGGFHRYSTDAQWLVPHFEKMLYDNAQLASVYARAYELTGDAYYGQIVRETLDYVLREMTSPRGGFYSAQDAEVNGHEGDNYLWRPREIREALMDCWLAGEESLVLEIYGLNAGGNFRDPHHPADGTRNVLHLEDRPDESARALEIEPAQLQRRLAEVKECLLAARDRRPQPATDDKILTGWNGLMIVGMVDGARALGDPWYLGAAERAARFVLEHMRSADGGLVRSYRDGRGAVDALSRDYAMFIAGLIALHRATVDAGSPDEPTEWLAQAVELAGIARQRFWDGQLGGYFDTQADQQDLFVRTKPTRDGVVPCANSLMLSNLVDLFEVTGDEAFLDDAVSTLLGLSAAMHRNPTTAVLAALGLQRLLERYPDRLPGRSAALQALVPRADPVEVVVEPPAVTVAPGAPGRFDVTLTVPGPHHVNAHDPGAPGLAGLSLQLVGRGYEIDVDYPAGHPFRMKLQHDDIQVYTGRVTIPVIIRQVDDDPSRPRIVLTYQVCTDHYCLDPVRTLLEVEIGEEGTKARRHEGTK